MRSINTALELSFNKRQVRRQQSQDYTLAVDAVDGQDLRQRSTEILNEAKTKCKVLLAELFEIVCYLVCAILYVSDIGSDLWTAYFYWNDAETWHFLATIAIVALSSLTMLVIGLYFYVCDYLCDKEDYPDDMEPTWVWTVRFVLTACCLGPFLRYLEIAVLGVMSKTTKDNRKKNYYRVCMDLAIHEGALLGLVESFFESAPQLGIQLYIMQTQGPEENFRLIVQTTACISSWCSCACAIVTWSRSIRVTRRDKKKLSYPGIFMLFFWTLLTIGPRTLALALFASIDMIGYYALIAIGCHWILVTIYVISCRTDYCNHKVAEIFFNMVLGFIYVFTFFNLKDGRTRWRYTVFYMLVYAENLGMVVTWFLYTPHAGNWYYFPAFIFVILGFMVGILFMFMYYLFFHPERKCCLGPEEGATSDLEEGKTGTKTGPLVQNEEMPMDSITM